jgi:hypothetical protein
MKQNVFSGYNKQNMYSLFFCSTLSEFENFFLCERQANFKDFKRFGAFKELVEQKKKNVFNSFVCKLGFFGTRGPFQTLI